MAVVLQDHHMISISVSYENGVNAYLTKLTDDNQSLWSEAQAGNTDALNLFATQFKTFDNILTVAFRIGDIFTNNESLAPSAAMNERFGV